MMMMTMMGIRGLMMKLGSAKVKNYLEMMQMILRMSIVIVRSKRIKFKNYLELIQMEMFKRSMLVLRLDK